MARTKIKSQNKVGQTNRVALALSSECDVRHDVFLAFPGSKPGLQEGTGNRRTGHTGPVDTDSHNTVITIRIEFTRVGPRGIHGGQTVECDGIAGDRVRLLYLVRSGQLDTLNGRNHLVDLDRFQQRGLGPGDICQILQVQRDVAVNSRDPVHCDSDIRHVGLDAVR